MIRLFTSNETNYNHNKWVLNDAITCIVTETVDGIFDLDLTYPLNDTKNLSQYLVRGNTIKCPISQTDSRGEQLFTIRKRTPSTKENRVIIYAQAKARRDLDLNMVLGMKTTGTQTRKQALQMLLNSCVEPHSYVAGSLDTNTNTNINLGLNADTGEAIDFLDINGVSPRSGLLSGSENSIFKAYGGEIIYNNFELNMVDERGTDHNFLIKSGKNLEDLQQDIDDTDLENFATAILPCSADGLYLPNSEIIYSPNATTLGKIFKKIVFDDVTAVDGTDAAMQAVYTQLRERVQSKFNDGMDKLKINNTINFIQLANTEEYRNYATLERCEIGNNVTVRYYKRDDENVFIEAVGRVVKIKFNVLKNKIEEVEVGDRKKKSIVDTINSTTSNISNVNNKANTNTVKIKEAKKATSELRTEFTVADGKISAIVQEGDTVGSWVLKADSVETAFKKTDSYSNFTQSSEQISAVVQEDSATGSWVLKADSVEIAFKDTDSNTRLTQTSEQISAVVTSNDGGASWELDQDSVSIAIKGLTDMNVVFDSYGQTIKNGAFQIKNQNGTTVMWINSSGVVMLHDLYFDNAAFASDSNFASSLANMESISFNEIKPGRLTISDDEFYITMDGENGYNLTQAIEKVLSDNSLI